MATALIIQYESRSRRVVVVTGRSTVVDDGDGPEFFSVGGDCTPAPELDGVDDSGSCGEPLDFGFRGVVA